VLPPVFFLIKGTRPVVFWGPGIATSNWSANITRWHAPVSWKRRLLQLILLGPPLLRKPLVKFLNQKVKILFQSTTNLLSESMAKTWHMLIESMAKTWHILIESMTKPWHMLIESMTKPWHIWNMHRSAPQDYQQSNPLYHQPRSRQSPHCSEHS